MRALLSIAGLGLATSLAAQNVAAGFTFNVSVGATSRGALQGNAGELLFRFSHDDYRGWGDDQGAPTNVTNVNGLQFILQDQNDTTVEPYDIYVYGEDLATPNPHFPNFTAGQPVGTNALAHFGPFNSPGGTAGAPAAWFVTVTFATPLGLPDNQDIFGAVALQAAAGAGWTADGLSVQINLGFQPNAGFTVYDLKGAGLIGGGLTANSYGAAHNPATSALAYGGPRQGYFDWLVSTTIGRGTSTAITNETSYTISNASPGTGSFFSGLHPDSAAPPFNGGRADTPCYVYQGATAGSIVFYLVDFSFGPFPLALNTIVPGSTGIACLNVGVFQTLGFALASGSGVDTFTLTLSPGSRTLIAGMTLVFQGVAFDTVNNVLHAGACGAQRF